MTKALYDAGREGFLAGDISWRDDTIRALLVDTNDYTVDLTAHRFLSDVPSAARVATSDALTGKTFAAGVADADDAVWTKATGDESEAIVLYADTGTVGTSRLISYVDEAGGLPVLPNGGDISVTWDSGADRIFRL